MVSNNKVKQWTLLQVADDEFYLDDGERPDSEYSEIKVMPVEAHEQIVAEKDAEIARLIQEVANRNQYKLNQEALDNVHKVYEEQLAEARQLISSLLSGVEFYSSNPEYDNGSFADHILEQNEEILKNFGRTI